MKVLNNLANLLLVERVLVQESIAKLITNPPTLHEPLTEISYNQYVVAFK